MKRLFHRKDKNKSSSELGSSAGATPPPTAQYPSPGVTPPPPAATPANAQQPPPGMVAVQGQQGATYVPRPPRVQDVGNAIGWSVAMTAFDFGYLLELADYLASSTSASKEAAKALTKEFKVSWGQWEALETESDGYYRRRRSRSAHVLLTVLIPNRDLFAARDSAGARACSPLDRYLVPQHRHEVPPYVVIISSQFCQRHYVPGGRRSPDH